MSSATSGVVSPAGQELLGFISRIERLRVDKAEIADDEKAVFAEAKSLGYDTAVLRELLKLRAKDANEREEFQALLDSYACSIGMDLFGNPDPASPSA